jgi:hypothetical protein
MARPAHLSATVDGPAVFNAVSVLAAVIAHAAGLRIDHVAGL